MDAAGPQLKIVASMSVGFDHIDVKAAAERKITVTNTPGMVDNAVAEHTIALMLALAKSIPQADAFYRDVLGLKLMARYPGASFFASGGYHHHLGANIWNSRGATARASNMTGLSDYKIRFNDKATLDAAVSKLDALEIKSEKRDGGVFLRDPWGIGLTLSA